jgi:hypothetical protein
MTEGEGMNRQQRRLAAKEARARAAIRTEKEHEEKTINDRISIIMIEQFYTAVGLALHDEFQFGQQRITRVWRRMNDLMFSIGEDVENYNRMVQELKDKCDLSISWVGGENDA